jgi:hypothetical protein
MLHTRKMKKRTVWRTWARSRLVCKTGRIRSIEAPVVPMKDASTDPSARNTVLVRGVATRSPRSRTPPEITNSPARRTMNETYSSAIVRRAPGRRAA